MVFVRPTKLNSFRLTVCIFRSKFARVTHLQKVTVVILTIYFTYFSLFRSLYLMGLLTIIGSAIGAYIMGMAALSPCPLLVDNIAGSIIIVSMGMGAYTMTRHL